MINYTQVDIAYIPFIERFHLIFKDVMNVDITAGRPNLAYWLKVTPFYSVFVSIFHLKDKNLPQLISGYSPSCPGDEHYGTLHRNPSRSTRDN